MINRVLLAVLVVFTPVAGVAEELPSQFGPSPMASVESRLDALEVAVSALEIRMTEVERVANEEYIRKIVKEIVTTELRIQNVSSGQVKTQTVSYAGYGSFELKPGEVLVSVDGVPVQNPKLQDTFMGEPSAVYDRGGYQYRIQQPRNTRVRRRMWIRRAPVRAARSYRAVSSGNCANGQCSI